MIGNKKYNLVRPPTNIYCKKKKKKKLAGNWKQAMSNWDKI